MSSKKDTNPNTASICVLLARGDHAAGMLLDRINHWSRYGKATIPGVEGQWCANDRPWWMREACLSPGQLDRSFAKLAKLELVEKHQFPFAGRNVLHARPSDTTRDILASAKTWDMTLEVLTQMGIPIPAWLAEPGTQVVPSLQEMINVWGKENLTAQEVGKLAVYRQDMKSVAGPDGEKYDFSENTLPLIVWAIENWTHLSTKDAPEPSVAVFCDNWPKALNLAMKEVEEAKSKKPLPSNSQEYEDPFEDEFEPA